MKKSLADRIEEYIKVLIDRSDDRQIEIQRAELAETFCCVPSQVSYVLSTRFTEKEGYMTESRRGGGGYVRITEFTEEHLQVLVDQSYLKDYLRELAEQNLLTWREAELIYFITLQVCKSVPVEYHLKIHEAVGTALNEYIRA
ncbi:MAG TPA: CtsR family transcriptional regulator [Syntrophomonadaceae bacterium]|nr:CtsR family transcriptional regulator [Syntrophomonadaceae bacterium]